MSNPSKTDKKSLFDESLDHLQSALANWEAIESKPKSSEKKPQKPISDELSQKNQDLIHRLKQQINKLS